MTVASPAQGTGAGGRYYPGLDMLRGLAVVLVLWHHCDHIFLHPPAFRRLSAGAWVGVDLFFVLSGFLITEILLRLKTPSSEETSREATSHEAPPREEPPREEPPAEARTTDRFFGKLKKFWVRRALRIFPLAFLYLVVLVMAVAVGLVVNPLRPSNHWYAYPAYLANLDIARHGWPRGPLGILWSLSLEEQFYSVWPLLVLSLPRRWLVVLTALGITVAPVLRFAFESNGNPWIYVHTSTRYDTLLVGALVAELWSDPAKRSFLEKACRRALPAGTLVLLVIFWMPLGPTPPATSPPWFNRLGYSAIAFAWATFVVHFAARSPQRPLERALGWPRAFFGRALVGRALVGRALVGRALVGRALVGRALVGLGRLSYGLYVWHYLLGSLVVELLRPTWGWLRPLIWILLTLGWTSVVWRYFEKPFLDLKQRLT